MPICSNIRLSMWRLIGMYVLTASTLSIFPGNTLLTAASSSPARSYIGAKSRSRHGISLFAAIMWSIIARLIRGLGIYLSSNRFESVPFLLVHCTQYRCRNLVRRRMILFGRELDAAGIVKRSLFDFVFEGPHLKRVSQCHRIVRYSTKMSCRYT